MRTAPIASWRPMGRCCGFTARVSVERAVEGGSPELHGLSVDITAVKRAEEELKALVAELDQARGRFLDLVNNLDQAVVWEVDAATLRFSFVSEQAEHLTGFSSSEWKGDPHFWSAHVPAEDWERLRSLRDESITWAEYTL